MKINSIVCVFSVVMAMASLVFADPPSRRAVSYSGSCGDPGSGDMHHMGTPWYGSDCTMMECIRNENNDLFIKKQSCILPHPEDKCWARDGDKNLKFPACCPALVCYE